MARDPQRPPVLRSDVMEIKNENHEEKLIEIGYKKCDTKYRLINFDMVTIAFNVRMLSIFNLLNSKQEYVQIGHCIFTYNWPIVWKCEEEKMYLKKSYAIDLYNFYHGGGSFREAFFIELEKYGKDETYFNFIDKQFFQLRLNFDLLNQNSRKNGFSSD